MARYLARRLAAAAIVVLLVSFISFMLINLAPGNTLIALIGQGVGAGVSQDVLQQFEEDLGLDRPVLERYGDWLWNAVQGDLGRSLRNRTPVWGEIQDRLPTSLELVFFSSMFALLFSVPIGVLSAVRQGSASDYVSRVVAVLGLAVPNFWLGILVVVFVASWLGVSLTTLNPPYIWDGVWDNLKAFIAPSIVLGFTLLATTMRMTRSAMLEVMNEDYVRTARAKGLRDRVVIWRHAMRNAAIPVITIFGNQFAFLLGGTLVIEQIFRLDGVGRYAFTAINGRDFTAVVGVTVLLGTFVVVTNLLVDLSYGLVDPRIRYS